MVFAGDSLKKVGNYREDGWEVVLHSLMLGPSPGAKARGYHERGLTRDTGACIYIYIYDSDVFFLRVNIGPLDSWTVLRWGMRLCKQDVRTIADDTIVCMLDLCCSVGALAAAFFVQELAPSALGPEPRKVQPELQRALAVGL